MMVMMMMMIKIYQRRFRSQICERNLSVNGTSCDDDDGDDDDDEDISKEVSFTGL